MSKSHDKAEKSGESETGAERENLTISDRTPRNPEFGDGLQQKLGARNSTQTFSFDGFSGVCQCILIHSSILPAYSSLQGGRYGGKSEGPSQGLIARVAFRKAASKVRWNVVKVKLATPREMKTKKPTRVFARRLEKALAVSAPWMFN